MKLILLTKKHLLSVFLIFFILLGINGKAATKTYVSGTIWASIVWSPAGTPVAGDDLVFNLGSTALPITAMPAISFNSVTVNGASASGVLTFTAGTSGNIITLNALTVNGLSIFKVGGSGTIVKMGVGATVSTATLVSVNSGGVLDLNGQTVNFAGGLSIFITATGALINSSATAAVVTNPLTLGAATAISTTGDITINGVVSGANTLSKVGAGSLNLNGANTYTGATTISAGTVKLGSSTALGTAAGTTTISNGATLDLNGQTTTEPLVISGTLTNTSATAATNSGAITLTTAAIVNTNNPITLSGIISSTGTLTKTGTGTLTLSGNNTYTGATTITAGTLQLGGANRIAVSNFTLNGGTFSTGATTGFSEAVGTLALTDNSTIALGTGSHSLNFNASNAVGWTAGKTLTITGWTGTAGVTGTTGKIFFGAATGTLTAPQLAQISFTIDNVSYKAKLLATGEIVPDVYCSTSAPTNQPSSLTFNTINKTVIDGSFTGISPYANYLVVRTTGATPTNPVNGTAYTAGSSALGGTIVASSASTSFSNTGLTANTAYTYFVYAYYLNCGGTTPVYNVTNALTKTVTTSNTTNTWYVNDSSTTGDVFCTAIGSGANTGLSKSSPFLTLGAAVAAAAAGDTIYIDSGSYVDSALALNKALAIIGAGPALTLFANQTVRLMTISVSNVTVKGIRVTNYGSNETSGIGQVFHVTGGSGIVFDNVQCVASLGSANTIKANLNIIGGASVTVKNSLFKCSGFNGANGGGISINGATLTVDNTIFFGNDNIANTGGAIEIQGASTVTVTNSTFDTNTSLQGGAIAIAGTSTLNVSGSCFSNNKTEGSGQSGTTGGGAVFCSTTGIVNITDCSFDNNCIGTGTNTIVSNSLGSIVTCGGATSSRGGAIRQTNGTMNLTRVSFTGNASLGSTSGNDIHKTAGTMNLSQVRFNTNPSGFFNVVTTAGATNFADSGNPTASYTTLNPKVSGTTTNTNTSTPSQSPTTSCRSTVGLTKCEDSRAINCTTETVAPIIISCVPNKTLSCPAILPDYTAEVNALDDCSFRVSQSPLAGTSLPFGNTTVTMTVTDTSGNFSTCTFTVTVSSGTPATNFGDFASAVGISTNGGTSASFYNTSGSAANLIGSSTFTAANLGSYSPSSGTLKLTGAELKTFKSGTGNVCGGTLFYVVYTTGSRPAVPVFQSFAIPFANDCSGGTFPSGGPCTTGDQKWSTSLQSIDLTAYAAGSYTIEAYYAYTGSDTGGCGTTQYLNNSCSNYTATFTLSTFSPIDAVVDTPSVLAGGSTPSVLNNDTFNGVAATTSNVTLSVVTIDSHLTLNTDGTVTVAPGTPAGNYTLTYSICDKVNPSNCDTVQSTVTVTDLQTVAGTITADQNICKDSNPNDLLLTGNTGSVIKWQKSADFAFTTPIDIPSTSTTLSGSLIGSLATTTYFRAVVQNGTSTIEYSNVVTITVPSTTWNGTSWSNGEPTITTTAYMTGNYSLSTDIFACTLTVSNNAIVSIPSGYDVTLYGKLTVNTGSSFTLNNNSNLIQQTNVSNTGDITVKRMTSPIYRLDYTLWSSPVIGSQTLFNFSPLTSNIAPTNIRFYIYNTLTNQYNSVNPVTTTFNTAKGYLIRSPNNWLSYNSSLSPAPQKWTGSFTGVPRNGDVNFTMVNTGTNTAINATGNPYPSAILLDNFINDNSSNIEGTLWFWRKYNDNDNLVSYSTCSTIGCALTNNATYTDSNLISIGQGFMVKAKTGQTNLNFTNSMRSSENVNQFFKSSPTQMDRYWIKMTNSTNVSAGQNLIAYLPNATNDYNSGLDGLYSNDSSVAFYSKAGTQDVVINARPSFVVSDVLPLIFKTNVSDTYTFSLNQREGIFNGTQDVLLRDNYTNSVQNLSQGDYSFTSAIGTFSNRFDIIYQNTLGVNNSEFNSNQVVIYNQDNITHINSGNIKMNSLKIFDVQGRLLFNKSGINDNKTSLKLGFEKQVLFFQITSQDGETITKKVIN